MKKGTKIRAWAAIEVLRHKGRIVAARRWGTVRAASKGNALRAARRRFRMDVGECTVELLKGGAE